MTLWRLIVKEIRLRRMNFALGVVSVLGAVGVLVAQLTLLDVHDLHTRRILAAKQAETVAEMARMEDDYRKIMKKLGFNLLVLPEGQRLDDFYADGYAARDMPEEYVTKLADSGIMTVRHLLPGLEQKIRWPEQGQRTIILVGTRGEVPLSHRKPKEPMMVAVPPGSVVLGYEIWNSLGRQVGDTITLLGRKFKVSRCHPERGSKDDITMWIELAQAQELLNRRGRINAILALKCHCPGADLANIRKEIGTILPGVSVIELANKVVTRAEARDRAKAAAEAALESERAHRARLRSERAAFAAWLVPLVTLGAAVWIGLLALVNVRERTPEIGILRALGLRSRQIMVVFLTRALLAGVVGAVLGYGVGYAIGLLSGEARVETETAATLFRPELLVLVLVAAPLLAALTSWPPALIAARQDPALVLREG
ncbi:MAG: ABC transporter permease [Phycisphaerae bacterium]